MKKFTVKVNSELMPLIPQFLASRWADRKQMEQSIQKKDFDALSDLGHLLQGTPGCFGFVYLVQLGKRMEKAAKTKNLEKLKELQVLYEQFLKNHSIESSKARNNLNNENHH